MHPLLKARVSFRWLYRLGVGCCIAVALFLIYVLSFGPALKLIGRKPGSGQMLPKWVFVVYGPLFTAKAHVPSAVDSLYERYLDLWCPEPKLEPNEKESDR
jgi:hypothetical protein